MAARNLWTILLCAILVAAPTALALTYYKMTGDPTFRPLSITLERTLEARVTDKTGAILVRIDWPTGGTERVSRQEASDFLRRGFGSIGEDVVIVFRDAPAQRMASVVYEVGHSTIGPYRLTEAQAGIHAAAAAVRMMERP